METLGSRILNLRIDKDIKQNELAQKIGITKSMLSKYENNINIPKSDILSQIADVLETTTDYLLCRTDDNSPLQKSRQSIDMDDYQVKLYNLTNELNTLNKVRVMERANTLFDLQNDLKRKNKRD